MNNEKEQQQQPQHLPAVNREYKDTLFRMIFREEKNLLQLYNAVNGTNYTDEGVLEIVTLENAIYMNVKNDLAFIIDFQLNLYEHQSTYNPNMPLRNLIYVAKEYQKLVNNQSIYSSTLVKIPTPRFIVFYNGMDEKQERCVLKLSDAFEKKTKTPELELKVLMININHGKNTELLEQCRLLKEYMQYVERVRTYAEKLPIEEAVEQAVTECIAEDILAEFLRKYRAEAIAVSIFEYNEEWEMEKLRKAEFAAGQQKERERMEFEMEKLSKAEFAAGQQAVREELQQEKEKLQQEKAKNEQLQLELEKLRKELDE